MLPKQIVPWIVALASFKDEGCRDDTVCVRLRVVDNWRHITLGSLLVTPAQYGEKMASVSEIQPKDSLRTIAEGSPVHWLSRRALTAVRVTENRGWMAKELVIVDDGRGERE